MPSAWLPALPRGGFSFSPAKFRFIDHQYQGVPDGAWLATVLTSLRNSPAIPPAWTENPAGEEAFFRIMFLWRNCFDNIGTRTWGQYHCVKRPCQGEFLADSQAIMTSAVMPFCTALRRGSRSRITRLSVKLGPTGTGNFTQFDRDTDLKLK